LPSGVASFVELPIWPKHISLERLSDSLYDIASYLHPTLVAFRFMIGAIGCDVLRRT